MPRWNLTIEERLLSKVEKQSNGCWQWIGANNGKGYGLTTVKSSLKYAHRVSYEVFVGPIPNGYEIDHTCNNKGCINPAHLKPVLHSENIRRAVGDTPDADGNITCSKCGFVFPAFIRGVPLHCPLCLQNRSRKAYSQNRGTILSKQRARDKAVRQSMHSKK